MSHKKDMTGLRFGSLVVLGENGKTPQGQAMWLCKCDCGATKTIRGADLRNGKTTSCGAGVHKIGMNVKDLTGKRFGRLTVLRRGENDNSGFVKWVCKCDCGTIKQIHRSALQSGVTISCGCWLKDNPTNVKHNLSKTRIYGIWCAIKTRCYDENLPDYKNYGGRGIKVCDEWKNDPTAFIEWALKNGYDDTLSIDRIDVNGNYEPSNCRWATNEIQANNKRTTIYLEYNGVKRSLFEWCKITGLKRMVIYNRVFRYHWSVGRALGYEK